MKKALLVFVLLVGLAGWLALTPYLAVRGMKSAADAKDSAALSAYVDFPAVRESLIELAEGIDVRLFPQTV